MKKVITLLMAVAFVFTLNAQNGVERGPKATNYKEVLKEITYPQNCRDAGIEGKVLVMLKISKRGTIKSYEFLSAPSGDIEAAVESSLSKLTFEPALNAKGHPVTGQLALPINFKLSI